VTKLKVLACDGFGGEGGTPPPSRRMRLFTHEEKAELWGVAPDSATRADRHRSTDSWARPSEIEVPCRAVVTTQPHRTRALNDSYISRWGGAISESLPTLLLTSASTFVAGHLTLTVSKLISTVLLMKRPGRTPHSGTRAGV